MIKDFSATHKPRFVRVHTEGVWQWACYSIGVVNGCLIYAYGTADRIAIAHAHWYTHARKRGLVKS